MNKLFILLFLSMCSQYIVGQSLSWPFTDKDLALFKMAKVWSITYDDGHNYTSSYLLNKEGQIISVQTIKNIRSKYENPVEATGEFRYNKAGKLTYSYYGNEDDINYDSITYNDEGRLISIYQYNIKKIKNKSIRKVEVDARFMKEDGDNYILADSILGFIYTYDKKNKLIKTKVLDKYKMTDYNDSLSTEIDSAGLLHEYNWQAFQCIERIYKKGLLIKEIAKPSNAKYKPHLYITQIYTYDTNNKLQSIIPFKGEDWRINNYQGPKVFYTYNSRGLVKDKITLSQIIAEKEPYFKVEIRIEKFTYSFF